VTQKQGAKRPDFQAFARSKGASDLMVPADIMVVDKLPVLGSGKVDNLAVASLVREHFAAKTAAAE
jgi:acyl-[acyl-carrier-protein]-phospholipid O-acyltransferase/long-chain-fatty-acid--[acyl-carrier-protein] ligase